MGISALKSTSEMRFPSICGLSGCAQEAGYGGQIGAALGPSRRCEWRGLLGLGGPFPGKQEGQLPAGRRASLEPARRKRGDRRIVVKPQAILKIKV